MSDDTTTFRQVRDRLEKFVAERDWEQFHAPKNLSMAIAAEAAELMEHFLWDEAAASRNTVKDPVKRAKIEEELADIVIYALEFANAAQLDIATAIERKLTRNAEKYPIEKAKGNARKYTEF
jgi:NTP pyrophosphatase (non-canonical NTP hydrolase)